jgi:hypothetical protein
MRADLGGEVAPELLVGAESAELFGPGPHHDTGSMFGFT